MKAKAPKFIIKHAEGGWLCRFDTAHRIVAQLSEYLNCEKVGAS